MRQGAQQGPEPHEPPSKGDGHQQRCGAEVRAQDQQAKGRTRPGDAGH
jgi:hypothetical protein